MKNTPRFISLGAILVVCLGLMMGIGYGQPVGAMSSLGSQGPDTGLFNTDGNLAKGELNAGGNTIQFPWSDKGEKGWVSSVAGPANQDIALSGDNPSTQVNDMRAINTNLERTVTYDGTQELKDGSLGSDNVQNIQVTGKGHAPRAGKKEADPLGDGIENRVDQAFASCMKGALGGTVGKGVSNGMNIDISGISASAVNTAEGGSAVVNNNIIVKPVQVIYVPYSGEPS